MVANIHAWCHAMLCVGEDLDERPLGISENIDPNLYEALAQYCTHQYLAGLNNSEHYDTFVELLTLHPPPLPGTYELADHRRS